MPAAPHNRSRGRELCAPVLQVGKLRTEEDKDRLKVTQLDRQDPGVNPAIRPMRLGERDNFWGKWGTRPRAPKGSACLQGREKAKGARG